MCDLSRGIADVNKAIGREEGAMNEAAKNARNLKKMGMSTAFDGDRANFSSMATLKNENIYISDVIHKTFIEVAEKGTRAGAATAVIVGESAAMPVEQPKEVRLTRPFVYAIIDTRTNLPLFIGAQTDI